MADMMVMPENERPQDENHTCYLEPASEEDVMFDQLEWLLDHSAEPCAPGCPDCARLESVKRLLLEPFDLPAYPAPRPHRIAA
jgi:hypothetical protein